MTKHNVFVYGTLKKGFWNNGLLRNSTLVGSGVTVSDSFTMYDGGFPYVVPDGLNRVSGEVYVVEDDVLANLDRLEGVPHHYIRKEVDVLLSEEEEDVIPGLENIMECNVYVANPKVSQRLGDTRARVSPDRNNICSWSGK